MIRFLFILLFSTSVLANDNCTYKTEQVIENGIVVKEDTKTGITKSYNSNEASQIFETSLSQYKIIYDKTFVQGGRYRSYVVIEYKLDT